MFAGGRGDKIGVSVKVKGEMGSCVLSKPWGWELGRGMAGAEHGGCQAGMCLWWHLIEEDCGRKLHSMLGWMAAMFSRK